MFAVYESLEAGAKSVGQASFKVRVYVRGNIKYFKLSDRPSARMRSLEHVSVFRYLKAAVINQDGKKFVRAFLCLGGTA